MKTMPATKKKRVIKKKDIFAAYRGDTYVMEGTADEIAERFGVSRDYVLWVQYPAAQKRAEKFESNQRLKSKGRLHVVKVEKLRGEDE